MKYRTIKTALSVGIAGAAIILLGACSSGSEEVEATPVEPQPIGQTITATAIEEASGAPVVVAPRPEIVAPVYEAGTLLRGGDEAVFYVTAGGDRQRFHNSDTFRAFGFSEKEIVEVDDKVLEMTPLAGVLTRLVLDDQDNLYWIEGGRRLQVNAWKEVVMQEDYLGLPVGRLDETLQAALPVQGHFERGALLHEGETVYYYNLKSIIPVKGRIKADSRVIDVPPGVLATYRRESDLEDIFVKLNADTQAANLRAGPGLEYEVLDTIRADQSFEAQGRTTAGSWLRVSYQDQSGWLAAALVEAETGLDLLRVVDAPPPPTPLPQAQPAAVAEKTPTPAPTPTPIVCTTVPLRGFGQVWGAQPGVKQHLGCPILWQGGEQQTTVAFQTFQHGTLLWLAPADQTQSNNVVYAFFDDGDYQRFEGLDQADPAAVKELPADRPSLGDKFSQVYWEGTGARVKERLGHPTAEAVNSDGAFQQFNNGHMFWVKATDNILVVYDYSRYQAETDEYVRLRGWAHYEDAF